MENLKLLLCDEISKEQYETYYRSFGDETIIPYMARKTSGDYDALKKATYEFHNNIDLPDYLVPSSLYFLVKDNLIIGAVDIRHSLNENLMATGGHIGYGIIPSQRNKGYGKLVLKMALDICKKMNLEKVLLTCDKENMGSSKVIVANGGILENEIIDDNGELVQRYWITI